MRTIMLIVFILIGLNLQSAAQNVDSTLTYKQFIDRVINFHPLSKIADMEIDQARALLLDARSGFEPEIRANGDSKTIDSKNYWDKRSAEVSVATPFAAKLKSGFETADGDFLNPENNTAESGQWFTEVELPLLRGLLTDKRRIQLRKAENQLEASRAQRRNLQNRLLDNATSAYWNWQLAWNRVTLTEDLRSLALERHQGIVTGFRNGDFAAIDTLESYNQWLNRSQQLRDARISEINTRAEMAAYLWAEEMQPAELPDNYKPNDKAVNPDLLDDLIKSFDPWDLANQLPQAEIARLKRDNKALENRLARENLKPELNLSWKQFAASDFGGGAVDINDNQVALTFKVPLFLRSSRAQAQSSKIQLNNAELMLKQKLRELSLQVQAQFNEVRQLQKQSEISNRIAENFLQLARAEEREFGMGESSLFLINQRENKYQEARLKAFQVQAKLNSNMYKLYWLLQDEIVGDL